MLTCFRKDAYLRDGALLYLLTFDLRAALSRVFELHTQQSNARIWGVISGSLGDVFFHRLCDLSESIRFRQENIIGVRLKDVVEGVVSIA